MPLWTAFWRPSTFLRTPFWRSSHFSTVFEVIRFIVVSMRRAMSRNALATMSLGDARWQNSTATCPAH